MLGSGRTEVLFLEREVVGLARVGGRGCTSPSSSSIKAPRFSHDSSTCAERESEFNL